ncbi:MAG: helix-turn-helix domain-containing protein [Lachnospiraceae bacterium]|nr:helix-turn-helix domain-containing protein [Lachnospiraceae bacterium]
MEPITIIMILLGIALLVGSCFFPKEDKSETSYDELINRLAKRELTTEETERIRQTVDQIVSEKTEEVIIKTDDYLSQVANEKIMSVDEFSKQILERMDKNNSDIMFLYNMVSDTKEELKGEIAKAERVKEALKQTVEEKEGTVPEKKKAVKLQPVTSASKAVVKKTVRKKETEEPKSTDDIAALLVATVTMDQDVTTESDLPKEKILALYKEGKSVRDISRELGMGQGEVKLVIDLYGL